MTDRQELEHEPWPLRAVLLMTVGAGFGLAIHLLMRGPEPWQWTEQPLRLAAAVFLASGGIVFAYSLERLRPLWSAAFAAAAGLVIGFVTYWNGHPDAWSAGEQWQLFSAFLAVAIAVPIFQASRDAGRFSTEYRSLHGSLWTNIVLWFASWAFVALVFLLTLLLSELFQLIGIQLLRDLLRKPWFGWVVVGAALGAAIGLLRDRDGILGLLQRVVTSVLSVLAPILALGLVLFVAALPFTGLQPLWDETSATTPILLCCALGAVVLLNTVIGSEKEEESRSQIVRLSGAALAAVTLPLALVAAISTGKRIGQHGFTPDRLWAAVFVAVVVATALLYLWSLVRGRSLWPERLRQANVRLALGICGLALFLALPIVSFGAISAKDQVARLESGQIRADRFDWAALRFDFGPAGKRAVERLARSADPIVRQRASEALGARDRWALARTQPEAAPPPPPLKLKVENGRTVPSALADHLGRTGQCYDQLCRLVFVEPARAVMMRPDCPTCDIRVFEARPDGTWVQRAPVSPFASTTDRPPEARNVATGRVEVRSVERRQVFIDGEPAGPAFE